MSEKRFTIDKIFKEYPKLRDNETECFYHLVDNERNAEIFCERLNNLVEENEQLEKGKMEALSLLGEEIDKNEQLKKQFKRYEDGLWVRFTRLEEDIEMLKKENEQLKQELQGMNELLESYRKTNKHLSELCADASKNGYLPPLDDIVRKSEIKEAWKQRTEKR